jgi:hypothetical protein
MKRISVACFGGITEAILMSWSELKDKDVRYIGTDYEMSGMDLYEDRKGWIYATQINGGDE